MTPGQCRVHGHRPVFRRPVPDGRAEAPAVGGTGGADRRAGQGGAAAGAADQPDDGGLRRRGAQRRPLHQRSRTTAATRSSSATTPRARVRRDVAGVRRHLPVRQRGRLPGGGAQVRRERRDIRDPCRGVRRRVRRTAPRRRRDHGQPDGDHGLHGGAAGAADLLPDILLTDGEAQLLADTPALGAAGRSRAGCRSAGYSRRWRGAAPRVMGANQIDRYGNQNLSAFGPLQHPTRQMFGVRGAGNTINHATSWVGNHSKRVFCDTSTWCPASATTRSIRESRVPVRQRAPGGVQSRRLRLQRPGPPDARGVAASRRRADTSREHLVRGARPGRGG